MVDLIIEYSKVNFLIDIVKISNGEIQKGKIIKIYSFSKDKTIYLLNSILLTLFGK